MGKIFCIWTVLLLFFSGCDNKNSITSLDSDKQDVQDLLDKAKTDALNENFNDAKEALIEIKRMGILNKDYNEVYSYVVKKQKEYDERIQREYQAKIDKERQTTYTSSLFSYGSANNLKNMCLAVTGKFKSNCYSIKDKDLKNACLGMTTYESNCYSIQNNDLKKLCIGKSKYPNECYGIQDKDLKSTCVGITKFPNECYSVKNKNLKLLCAGIALSSSNCYSIK